jgi:diguanylate cyclase
MLILPAAIGTFLLVNLLCACVALGLGFGAGVWFFGAKMAKLPAATQLPAKQSAKSKPNVDAQRAAERTLMATGRVADVARGVVGDVGDHAKKMRAISADLQGIDRQSSAASAEVATALDKILAANAELQQRLEQAEKQLAAQAAEIKTHESEARTDSLTGLNNRRAFDDELRRRLSEWERKQSPCTLILMDIDFFKKFNDTHGHQVGDEVLRQVAKTLKAASRDMDLPCRYGGEEFGIILPATAAEGACTLAERIRKAVEASTTHCDGKALKVTVSLGLSQLGPGDDIAQLIRRADEGLYASKKAGRNCGHWNTGEECVPITAANDIAPAAEKQVKPPATASEPPPPKPMSSAAAVAQGPTTGTNFIHILKRRVTESHRFGIPLSIMQLKIEQFEEISRTYGKPTARQMAAAATPGLEKCLREMDVLASLENGEFVVMLPGNTQSEAGQVAKRMRITMNSCSIPLVDRELHVRIRHSVAELAANETAQELLARARQGLAAAITPPRRPVGT